MRTSRWVWGPVRAFAPALVGALVLSGCTDGGDVSARSGAAAPSSTTTTESAAAASDRRLAEIDTVLRQRAAAIVGADRATYLGSLDSISSPFGVRQVAAAAAIAKLPFATFDYGTPRLAPALSAERAAQVGPEATVVRLDASYTLEGFDRAPRTFETYLTMVHREDGWRVADDADGGTRPQPWDLPGMRVVRSTTTLVAGNVPEATLRSYLALGEAAVADVRGAWPEPWGDRLVVVAPATTAQMAGQLQRDASGVAQVAAVTDGPVSDDGTSGADRVVVNPEAFARLSTDGQQVVLSHETTHVAIRRTTTSPVPTWWSEGFADYVGYTAVGVPRRTVASTLLAQVRAGRGPTALPSLSAFDPGQSTIAPSYNAAYLAVCRLVDLHGEAAVARTYAVAATRRDPPVGTDEQLAQAFSSELGVTVDQVTTDWLAYLQELAG